MITITAAIYNLMTIMDEIKFYFNSVAMIIAATSGGKSVLAKKFIKKAKYLLNEKPDKVIICHQPGADAQYRDLNATLVEGLPDNEMYENHINNPNENTILFLDDVIGQMSYEELNRLVCVSAHHGHNFILISCHNMFDPKLRQVRINSQYLFLLKNPGDSLGISRLASQLVPGQTRALVAIYKDATRNPWSYLLIDNHLRCPDNLRFKTNVFGEDEKGATVYTVYN